MKKIFGLLVCILLLSSCDDGDLVVETFNFDEVEIEKCDDKDPLFKINGAELLLVDIPASNFPNEVTPEGEPRIVDISSENRVMYRKYSDVVSNTIICSAVPPATPTVEQEWNAAIGGRIEIVTTEITTTDPDTGVVTITGYNHEIKFVNMEFVGSQNSFVYDEYLFGDYVTTP
ncbi:MAG TPA: hypothetical protein VLB74_05190 [Flavobacterium sp.]|uniref:hypothetical protein n=1 Tax=Flavobacterium sp. TaxID=239 RepID=UPI002BDE6E1D|nr:hypothetical protein [Flavobacterium sp.]HSD14022.1 hypothetical protein [Flavobacterium sp.]